MKALDREEALVLANGDNDLVTEVVRMLLEQQSQYVAAIEQAVQNRDIAQLERAATTLMGAAGSAGATGIYDLAVALETMAVNSDLEGAEEALARLHSESNRFTNEANRIEQ